MSRRVGVFVDPDDATARCRDRRDGQLEALQLHNTNPTRAAAIKARTGLEIWAWCRRSRRAPISRDGTGTFTGAADRILYDAEDPARRRGVTRRDGRAL